MYLSRKTAACYKKTRKATGFKSLRVNSWEIDQVTSKWQKDFLDKTCRPKKEKVNSTTELYLFELGYVKNFNLKGKL